MRPSAHRTLLPGPGLACDTSRRRPCGPRAPASCPERSRRGHHRGPRAGGRGSGVPGVQSARPRGCPSTGRGPRSPFSPGAAPASAHGAQPPPGRLSRPRPCSQPRLLGAPVPALLQPGRRPGRLPSRTQKPDHAGLRLRLPPTAAESLHPSRQAPAVPGQFSGKDADRPSAEQAPFLFCFPRLGPAPSFKTQPCSRSRGEPHSHHQGENTSTQKRGKCPNSSNYLSPERRYLKEILTSTKRSPLEKVPRSGPFWAPTVH